jgi:unsaturated chondroitin disaccharide hydrolase
MPEYLSDLNGPFGSVLKTCVERIGRTASRMGTDRPCIGRDDLTYRRCGENEWVDGFWSGQLWLCHSLTGDPWFMDAARSQSAYFVERLRRTDMLDHDLGFLYMPSLVTEYRVTGDPRARDTALAAADLLSDRYNPEGDFIVAWNSSPHNPPFTPPDNTGRVIVDTMLNLSLLFWASEETGNDRYRSIALSHAQTTRRFLVRPDGSTCHTFEFDPRTGKPLREKTDQGYDDRSCWSRGQAWALYGFALAYTYTGNQALLDTAVHIADFIAAHLPEDGVPLWDYRLPADAARFRDSSAAAINAAGFLLLADCAAESITYRERGIEIVESLSTRYMAPDQERCEGLLLHGAENVKAGLCDNMLPYGDYFFLESLIRAAVSESATTTGTASPVMPIFSSNASRREADTM